MIATPDIEQLIGAEAVDPNNDRIGKVSQVYVDAETDQPTWASVRTGLFGLSESLVPLDDATWDNEQLHVAVEKGRVKDAPRVDPEAEISPDEQERLYRYYGLSSAPGPDLGQGGRMGGGQIDPDRTGIGAPGMQDMSGSDADLRADVAMPGGDTDRVDGSSPDDTDADRVEGYGAATMSHTGYGAGAGATGAGLAGSGVGRTRGHGYDEGPSGPRYDRGQSAEADAGRQHTEHPGYGEVSDEPGGPDVRGSGRTAGDGRGSGDFASTGTALENDNPVAEEAAEGTGSGYGTSDEEDVSGRFFGDGGATDGHRRSAEMREAGATPSGDLRTSGGMRGAEVGTDASVGVQPPQQGDPAMQSGATAMTPDTTAMQQGAVGMQRQPGGGMRLRRYVLRQEPLGRQDELRMQPGAGSSVGDASSDMRMDDQDPTDPGRR
jgi:hypothetical protein